VRNVFPNEQANGDFKIWNIVISRRNPTSNCEDHYHKAARVLRESTGSSIVP